MSDYHETIESYITLLITPKSITEEYIQQIKREVKEIDTPEIIIVVRGWDEKYHLESTQK